MRLIAGLLMALAISTLIGTIVGTGVRLARAHTDLNHHGLATYAHGDEITARKLRDLGE